MIDYFSRLFRRFREERFAQLAASLSFTTLLSLVPLVAVVIMIGNKVPWVGGLVGYLDDFIIDYLLPSQTGDVVARYAYRFSRQASRLTFGGAVLLLVASTALMFSIERAFNHLWQVRQARTIAGRIALYTIAIAILPLVAGGLLASSAFLIKLAMPLAGESESGRYIAVHSAAGLMLWGLFALLYVAAPACTVRWPHALTGGAVAAAGVMAAQRVFSYAISQASVYKTMYGAFSALPIFLIWLYLCWAIVLVGALVAANFGAATTARRR